MTSPRRSKFQELFDETRPEDDEPPSESGPPPAPAAPALPIEAPQRARKAPGKSSDPDYTPVTIYVRKKTYQRVQVRMIELGRKREVSDLVNELLETWLSDQQPSTRLDF